MPIKGLTDNLRMPRRGKIHLGIRTNTQSQYPQATDYFVCDDPDFRKIYGPKPKELDIVIPVDDINIFAPTWYKRYTKAGLVCRGNGERGQELIGTGKAGKDYKDIACPCQYAETKICKPICCFQFLLPRVAGIGVWQIDTGSVYGITGLYGSVAFILGLAKKIASLPLALRLVPKTVQVPGEKGAFAKEVYILELAYKGDYNRLMEYAALPAAMLALPEADDIPEPDEDTPTDLYPVEQTGRIDNSVTAPAAPAPAPVASPASPASTPAPSKNPPPAQVPQERKETAKAPPSNHYVEDEAQERADLITKIKGAVARNPALVDKIDTVLKKEGYPEGYKQIESSIIPLKRLKEIADACFL